MARFEFLKDLFQSRELDGCSPSAYGSAGEGASELLLKYRDASHEYPSLTLVLTP